MSDHGLLFQAFVYLLAAVVSVPFAQRLGLGSVLGYLLAGIAIGPFGLGMIGTDDRDLMHFAEFGVVMMLFVIGLELQPALLWRLRGPIVGLGGAQVVITTAVVAAVAFVYGIPGRGAVAIGMTLAMSSTAIVLQTLQEKGLLKTAGGQSAFAVLLFQDIAVIPMLAIFPLLTPAGAPAGAAEHATLVSTLPAWAQTASVLGAVAIVVVLGRFVMRPVFRLLAQSRLREIFTAAALVLVVGIALLMTAVGLSPALGTFLAGVVLATSEYRHELESDIEPFKGLLLGLFFLAVGASIDFGLIAARPLLILGLVGGVILVKGVVLAALGQAFGHSRDQALLLGFALPQVGEFAFVLMSFAVQERVLEAGVAQPIVAAVAITMAATPPLLAIFERVLAPRVGTRREDRRPPDVVDEQGSVLIAGFGGFGSTVGRFLRAMKVSTTVLDLDSDRVDLLRRMGLKVFYGDATRVDLLHAAGAEQARVLIIALDSPDTTHRLADAARRQFPHLTILARAFDWQDAHDLLALGITHVYREALDSSLRAGEDALRLLGFRAHQAHRAADRFRRHDEQSLRELTQERRDRTRYISATRQRIQDLERMFDADRAEPGLDRDSGWDAESLREDARAGDPPPTQPAPSAVRGGQG
ncbi:MAG: monovalent cation:proton antiporter-2 (CPA2) family protein [Vicinamibacterales bacterium]